MTRWERWGNGSECSTQRKGHGKCKNKQKN